MLPSNAKLTRTPIGGARLVAKAATDAVDEAIAAVLEGQHQEGRHHRHHAQHDAGVGEGVPRDGASVVAL